MHGFSQHWYAYMQILVISETTFGSAQTCNTVVLKSLSGTQDKSNGVARIW